MMQTFEDVHCNFYVMLREEWLGPVHGPMTIDKRFLLVPFPEEQANQLGSANSRDEEEAPRRRLSFPLPTATPVRS
jgi:hypothetical protein